MAALDFFIGTVGYQTCTLQLPGRWSTERAAIQKGKAPACSRGPITTVLLASFRTQVALWAAMFTGIVEEAGVVQQIRPTNKSIELTVKARTCAAGLKIGASLAVNGCCLTVVKLKKTGTAKLAQFDLLKETWSRTNLQHARVGSLVNLERPLRADGELGGHFVTGHIDGLGIIRRWERAGQDHVLDIEAPPEIMRYLVFKGSVAVDGISLTVAGVKEESFRIWIIPHTYEVTALRERKIGDAVNLEADLLGKYVEKFLTSRRA
jgi:riboflavin synthase